jgi:hypothetical protein
MTLSSKMLRVVVLGAVASTAIAQTSSPPTIAGAISDSPPKAFPMTDGGEIRVYDAARNEAYRADSLEWSNMSYYYLAPLRLLIDPQLHYASKYKLGNVIHITIRIQTKQFDMAVLSDIVRRTVNPSLRPGSVLPLSFETLSVSLTTDGRLQPFVMNGSGVVSLMSQAVTVDFSLPSDPSAESYADDVVNAINQGQVVPNVSAVILSKLSALNQIDVTWDRITTSGTYQSYTGPSGPKYVTAVDTARYAATMAQDLRIQEIVEAPASARADLLDWIKEGITSPTTVELQLSSPSWAQDLGLQVNVGKFIAFTDEVKHVAVDARNLSDQQWCIKKEAYKKDYEKRDRDDRVASGFNYMDFLSGSFSGNATKNNISEHVTNDKAQDCGRNVLSKSFNYDWDGHQWIPKSIYVHQRVDGSARVAGSRHSKSLVYDQKYVTVDLQVLR